MSRSAQNDGKKKNGLPGNGPRMHCDGLPHMMKLYSYNVFLLAENLFLMRAEKILPKRGLSNFVQLEEWR